MQEAHLDYETYATCEIGDVGAYKYARHPNTDIICAELTLDDGTSEFWAAPEPPGPLMKRLDEFVVSAHNCPFEHYITNEVASKWGVPKLRADQMQCTMVRALHANLPRSLDGASETLGTRQRKDKEGHALMLKVSKPKKDGARELDPKILRRVYEYCKQDVATERELDESLPPLPEQEREYWLMDREIGMRGLPIDEELCLGAAHVVNQASIEIGDEIAKLTDGRITRGTQTIRIREYINERGVNTDTVDADFIEATLKENLPDDVRKILELRQTVASSAVAKYKSALRGSYNGRVHDSTIFYGASQTGRVAGVGLQPLNFKRGLKNIPESTYELATKGDYGLIKAICVDSPVQMLSNIVRGIIKAPPGMRLVDADSSQIELRIVHWLAGDTDMMEALRRGFDPYKGLAARTLKKPVDAVTSDERNAAKPVSLGCLGADTKTLTDSGWKRLEDVTRYDLLWDGVEWVEHEGLLRQGLKKSVNVGGVWSTPDHLFLAEGTWFPATEVLDESIFSRVLATGRVKLPSWAMNSAPGAVCKISSSCATVISCCTQRPIIGSRNGRCGAGVVVRRESGSGGGDYTAATPMLYQTTISASDCLIVSAASLVDVQNLLTQGGKIMGVAESRSMGLGCKVHEGGEISCPFWSGSRGCETVATKLIGLTTIEGMSPETCDSYPPGLTRSTSARWGACRRRLTNYENGSESWKDVFDIANAGPRSRFTIWTDAGPCIVHNCQYGMHYERFSQTSGLPYHKSTEMVDQYRADNKCVVKLWYRLEDAMKNTIRRGVASRVAGVTFRMEDQWMTAELPSGRKLYYFRPCLAKNKYDKLSVMFHRGAARISIKGSHVLENISQAISRDLVYFWQKKLHAQGVELLLNVYDQILSQAATDDANDVLQLTEQAMLTNPEWAPDLPLGMDGAIMERWRK